MTNQPPKPVHPLPQMDLPADIHPAYSNAARITHFAGEFILDFAQMMPGLPNSVVVSRIVTSPISAKALFRALGENLKNYENNFGEIQLPPASNLADKLFKGVQPAAGADGEATEPGEPGAPPEEKA